MSQITWTTFASASADSMWVRSGSLNDLGTVLLNQREYPNKHACPWIKLAQFSGEKTSKGSLRHDGAVVAVFGVEGDYDGGEVTPHEAIHRLERAGIRAIVYTSPSHTEERPRWRVLAPFSEARSPETRAAYLARVNGALGGILAGESFTLSQSYYYGRVVGAVYEVYCTYDDPEEGTCVDELDALDDIAVFKRAATADQPAKACTDLTIFSERVERLGRRLKTGDGRRELLKQYMASRSSKGLMEGELRALTGMVCEAYFDPADPPRPEHIDDLVMHFVRRDVGRQLQPSIIDLPSVVEQQQPDRNLVLMADLLAGRKPPAWVVHGFLARKQVSVLYGKSYVGKSFVAVDFACHVASGRSWHGHTVNRGLVVYVAGEGNSGLADRVLAWGRARGMSDEEIAALPIAITRAAYMMDDQQHVAALRQEIDELQVKTGLKCELVIVDTLAQCQQGDENLAQDIGVFTRALQAIALDYDCHTQFLHHTGKNGDLRGSSALYGNPDARFKLTQEPGGLVLTCEKLKDHREPPPVPYDLESVILGEDSEGEEVVAGTVSPISARVTDEIVICALPSSKGGEPRDAVTLGEVAKILVNHPDGMPQAAFIVELAKAKSGVSQATVSRAMSKLAERGIVIRTSDSRQAPWRLTEAGIGIVSRNGGLLRAVP